MKKLAALHMDRCTGCQACALACAERVHGQDSPDCAGIRIHSTPAGGFEAITCAACDPAPCARACPAGSLTQRKGGGVLMDRSLCIRCGFCARFCPVKAVHIDPATAIPYMCIQCGRCVSSCPHGCLALAEV